MPADYSNTFSKEPVFNCPKCGTRLHTDFVDNGFGAYAVQVSPYHCEPCEWVEGGCPAERCLGEQCFSWSTCQGKAITGKHSEASLSPPVWQPNAEVDQLRERLGNVIRGTCNTIGCDKCHLKWGDNFCSATDLQNKILDIEMADFKKSTQEKITPSVT